MTPREVAEKWDAADWADACAKLLAIASYTEQLEHFDDAIFLRKLAATLQHPAPQRGEKCPTCDSPDPKLHPAMQFEGEVQLCRDSWHAPNADEIERSWQTPLSPQPAVAEEMKALRVLLGELHKRVRYYPPDKELRELVNAALAAAPSGHEERK